MTVQIYTNTPPQQMSQPGLPDSGFYAEISGFHEVDGIFLGNLFLENLENFQDGDMWCCLFVVLFICGKFLLVNRTVFFQKAEIERIML